MQRRASIVAGIATVVLALLAPGVAQAQAYRCAVPASLPRPHADLPGEDQPRRMLPIGGYTLAISWAPQYCRQHLRDPSSRIECGGGNRFGFTLHGLWPDGEDAVWPQYCRSTDLLPPPVIRGAICATPSAQLLQHEWAKHGTCMSEQPADYFAASTKAYARLRYPDMNALSRRVLSAGQFAKAMARANPGIDADMMRITANKAGWLDEVWLCMDKRRRFATCPAHQGGLAKDAPLKIWRGGR